MYESKGGLYVVSTSTADDFLRLISRTSFDIWPQNQWVQSNFQSFSLLRPQAIGKLTKFRCFKNRNSCTRLRISFHDALKFVAFNFRRKDAESFGSNKKYLNIETSTLFWTCLPFSSIFPTWLDKPHSRSSILDPRFSIPDSRFSILNSPFSILNSRSSIQDPRSSLPASRSSILEPRLTVLDTHGGPSGSYTCKISLDFVRIFGKHCPAPRTTWNS